MTIGLFGDAMTTLRSWTPRIRDLFRRVVALEAVDHRPIHVIWCEESGSLSSATSSGLQFSFGNGNVAAHGVAMPYSGEVVAISLQAEVSSATTGRVQVAIDGVAQGSDYELESPGVANGGSTRVLVEPLPFEVGAKLTFRTTTTDAATSGVTCCMWVRIDI